MRSCSVSRERIFGGFQCFVLGPGSCDATLEMTMTLDSSVLVYFDSFTAARLSSRSDFDELLMQSRSSCFLLIPPAHKSVTLVRLKNLSLCLDLVLQVDACSKHIELVFDFRG